MRARTASVARLIIIESLLKFIHYQQYHCRMFVLAAVSFAALWGFFAFAAAANDGVGSHLPRLLSEYNVDENAMEWTEVADEAFRLAPYAIAKSIAKRKEAEDIVSALRNVAFDTDRDTVDEMPTHEFYLFKKNGRNDDFNGVRTIPGKAEGNDEALFAARSALRQKLMKIAQPILSERITPLVNERFSESCDGGKCTPCFSLIRRYLPGERRGHGVHFDIQALVTVVIALNDEGADFAGGLFVTTGRDKTFIPLEIGDAVMHQSNLLHGVQVKSGSRWSWIVWYKDTPDCSPTSQTTWHIEKAKAGDPVSQFLHFRTLQASGERIDPEAVTWLKRSSSLGFSRASNLLGHMMKHGAPGVKADPAAARELFEKSAEARNPDGEYNFGLELIASGSDQEVRRAVEYFQRAAAADHVPSMENLGIAAYKGILTGERDIVLALDWLRRAGSPSALFAASRIASQSSEKKYADQVFSLLHRSASLGSVDASRELGLYYLERDQGSEGERWLKKAAAAGDSYAPGIISAWRDAHSHHRHHRGGVREEL